MPPNDPCCWARIGADYGLLDCSTGKPLPDYWSSLLFSSLTSERVLSTLRIYAQCSNQLLAKSGHGVTVVLLNLALDALSVKLVDGAKLWQLTPLEEPGLGTGVGLNGTIAMLNGEVLQLGADGIVPDLVANGKVVGGEVVTLPPTSITFAMIPVNAPACR